MSSTACDDQHEPDRDSPINHRSGPAAERPNAAPDDGSKELRRMLCAQYSGSIAYMDDGEAQDNRVQPFIDFMRDTPAEILHKMQTRNLAAPTQSTQQPDAGEPVGSFINTAPNGHKPKWEQVDDEYADDLDAVKLYTAPVPPPQVAQGDERAAFERIFPVPYGLSFIGNSYSSVLLLADKGEHEQHLRVCLEYNVAWCAWQARAALSRQPSAHFHMYAELCEAMGYSPGKDDLEWSPEEWAAELLRVYRSQASAGDAILDLVREALELARDSHGIVLMSDPPQEAWKARRVEGKIGMALAALATKGAK